MNKISTRVVCVNSKYPVSHYRTGINFLIWCEFQDGVRFYIYFDSDYELDADSVEEKNKVSILGIHFISTTPEVHMICQCKNHQVTLLVRQTRKFVTLCWLLIFFNFCANLQLQNVSSVWSIQCLSLTVVRSSLACALFSWIFSDDWQLFVGLPCFGHCYQVKKYFFSLVKSKKVNRGLEPFCERDRREVLMPGNIFIYRLKV